MLGRISVHNKKQVTGFTYNETVINIKLQFEKPISSAVAIAIKRKNILLYIVDKAWFRKRFDLSLLKYSHPLLPMSSLFGSPSHFLKPPFFNNPPILIFFRKVYPLGKYVHLLISTNLNNNLFQKKLVEQNKYT